MSHSSANRAIGAVPAEPEDVGDVFRNHYSYYRTKDGEIAHQQQTGETQIRREYSGRVVFELLQNALDRAKSTVNVQLMKMDDAAEEYALVVANDGPGVRIDPEYEYDNPPDAGDSDRRRPDFNALCSLHTSNKSPEESIGTKGIGFRSVFSIETHVRVWSQFEETATWWGLEMHSPLDRDTWNTRQHKPAIERGTDRFLNGNSPPLDDDDPRPSYHFPLPLYADTSPDSLQDNDAISTAVVVPVPQEHKETLRDRIQEFRSQHLYFTGLDAGNRDITVSFETPDNNGDAFTRTTWPKKHPVAPRTAHWHISAYKSSALEEQAQRAEHDISEPGAAIAWPPEQIELEGQNQRSEPTVYGYLPTLIESPFGIDVHGDFQLSIDRTNIRLDDDRMGPYNSDLLDIAAELHLLQAIRTVDETLETHIEWDAIDPNAVEHETESSGDGLRSDYWQFLNPSTGESDVAEQLIDHVEMLLFSGDSGGQNAETYEYWTRLAESYFSGETKKPVEAFEQFWAASTAWIDRICSTKTRRTNWRRTALAMCDALRDAEAPVAPVVLDEDIDSATPVSAVPLPEQEDAITQEGGSRRHQRKLFLRSGDGAHLSLPEAMTDENRAVTGFDFASDLHTGSPNALGTTDFNRWEVLQELRQLPNASVAEWSAEPLAADPDRAVEQQHELISFAAELYLLDTGTNHTTPDELSAEGPGWRVLPTPSTAARRAGRALATLYLPTGDSKWAPARQLTRNQVSDRRLGPLPEDLPVDEFLTFLGVAPEPPEDGAPLTLVEGGERNGVVDRRSTPPALTPAGPGSMDVTLGRLPSDHSCDHPEEWYRSFQAAEDWLYPVLEAERTAATESEDEETDIPDRIDLLEPLGNRPWYPVDDSVREYASPPEGVSPDSAVPPRVLTLLTVQQPYLADLLWSVDRTAADETLLVILGSINGTDRETLADPNAEPAFRLLSQLRQLHSPNKFVDQPNVQTAFIQLFERILDAIVRSDPAPHRHDDLAVLTYLPTAEPKALSSRRLEWRPARTLDDNPAWIAATSEDQENMRRCFPDEPLVAATIGPEVIEGYPPLADYSVSIEHAVQSEPLSTLDADVDPDDCATRLGDELSSLVPKLLALAGADQQITVTLSDECEQWGPGVFDPVTNVWREYTASLGSNRTRKAEKHRDDKDTALLRTTASATDGTSTNRIQFGVSPDGDPPKLVAFGRPLAHLLLEEDHGQAASLFERGLQTYTAESEDLDHLVERRDATPLVHSYEQRIDPLPEELRADLLSKTRRALAEEGLALDTTAVTQLRSLSPSDVDVTSDSTDIAAADINKTLAELDLSVRQEQFRPEFVCRPENERKWSSWFDDHREQLVPYLLDLLRPDVLEDIEEDTLANRLDTYVRNEQLQLITFNSERAVRHWLRVEGLDESAFPDEILTEARQFVPSYNRVEEVTKAAKSDWSRRSLSAPKPSEDEHGTVDQEDEFETMRAQKAIGTDAERKALERVTERTQRLIEETKPEETIETVSGSAADGWEVLKWAVPDGGITAQQLQTAREQYEKHGNPDSLKEGLHISNAWDGAGYDLLGLARDEHGYLQPVRYEIKAISATNPVANVHLTSRQLAVYEKIHDETTDERRYVGDWRLWGVESGGKAVDLTNELSELPDDALSQLRAKGFKHDGLILRVTRDI